MLKRRRLPVPMVTPAQREILEQWVRRPTSAQALALRARIVLRLGEGHSSTAVAQQLGVHMETVSKWRERFVARGVDGLLDEPRPGQPRKISDAQVEAVLTRTLESKPVAATHWSTRSMAQAQRTEPDRRQPDLARLCPSAPPHGELQVEPRSAVHRQGARHRRSVFEPAGASSGLVRRRKEPDSGSRKNFSAAAHASRTSPTPRSRLPAPWNYQFVCRSRYQDRYGDRGNAPPSS
jgi:transposase